MRVRTHNYALLFLPSTSIETKYYTHMYMYIINTHTFIEFRHIIYICVYVGICIFIRVLHLPVCSD